LFGNATLNGRYTSSKAKYEWETDSEQVLRRKDEKNFGKRVKRFEIVEKEAVEIHYSMILKLTGSLLRVCTSTADLEVWSSVSSTGVVETQNEIACLN